MVKVFMIFCIFLVGTIGVVCVGERKLYNDILADDIQVITIGPSKINKVPLAVMLGRNACNECNKTET